VAGPASRAATQVGNENAFISIVLVVPKVLFIMRRVWGFNSSLDKSAVLTGQGEERPAYTDPVPRSVPDDLSKIR